MIVALIGPRGAGKTTIGRRLGETLSWPVLSTDAIVAEKAGKSISRIVAEAGWSSFREMESVTLTEVTRRVAELPAGQGLVLDCGGGLVLEAGNRLWLREYAWCVYLVASPEVLAARTTPDPHRPPLTELGDPVREATVTLAKREPLYRGLAQLVLETGSLGIEACVTVLQQWVMKKCEICPVP